MIKFFLGFIGIILLIVIIGVLVVAHLIRRGFNILKNAAAGNIDDEEFERQSNRHYRKKEEQPSFGRDYFRGSGRNAGKDSGEAPRRTVKTDSGVTIIDRRSPGEASRKIFGTDEGDYVDYTEEG